MTQSEITPAMLAERGLRVKPLVFHARGAVWAVGDKTFYFQLPDMPRWAWQALDDISLASGVEDTEAEAIAACNACHAMRIAAMLEVGE